MIDALFASGPWVDPSRVDLDLVQIVSWVILAYFVGLNLVYLALNLVALRIIGRESVHNALSGLPGYSAGLEPGIAIIVPAYNEATTIATAVRSMLQIDYPDYEVIVVNDGSKDDTLEVLKREFGMQLVQEAYRISIPVAPVRGMWRSPKFPNLRVVDKANGGRSDAVNAGVNAAHSGLICVVDADSVLQRDSLRRIARPFMEDSRVIASGGTVRISNGCVIRHGFIEQVEVPDNLLARIQVVEYLRGFLYGRMGWMPVNALLIISGAFGLFKRAAVVQAGGFSTTTIGEDMEMTVRLHRLNRLQKRDYRIAFVPDAVCWTEAPESLPVLRSQRTRWQRGLMETLWAHRVMFFHPRAGAVGWLAAPTMFVFEGLGPVVELLGYVIMTALVLTGLISWPAFGAFLLLAVGMGMLLSASALLLEELAFRTYKRPRQLLQLLGAIFLENVGYRQLTVWWRIVGLTQWITRRRQRWGEMARRGASG